MPDQRRALSISALSPQTAILKNHLVTENIIPKTPSAEREPKLPLAALDAPKFFHMMLAALIVRISGKNFSDAMLNISKFRVTRK